MRVLVFLNGFDGLHVVSQHCCKIVFCLAHSAVAKLVDPQTGLPPVHDGHVNVQDDQVEKVDWVRGHNLERLQSVLRFLKVEILGELERVRHPDEAFVVCEEHARLEFFGGGAVTFQLAEEIFGDLGRIKAVEDFARFSEVSLV